MGLTNLPSLLGISLFSKKYGLEIRLCRVLSKIRYNNYISITASKERFIFLDYTQKEHVYVIGTGDNRWAGFLRTR